MADKIVKFLASLPPGQLDTIRKIIESIESNDIAVLDIKSLKGRKGVYRVRSGSIRVIFARNSNGKNVILSIARRSNNTYRNI